MRVTHGDRKRVGHVKRRRCLFHIEEQCDHLLHLPLLGPPVADDRPFYFGWRVLDDREPRFDGSQHGDAPRVAQLERAAHVGRMKQALDGDAVGPAVRQERDQAAVNLLQLFWKRHDRGDGDGTADDNPMA